MHASIQRILVATDYSPSSKLALDFACSIANKFGADLHLLHVVVEPLPMVVPEGVWLEPESVLAALARNAKIALTENTKGLQLEPNVHVIREVKIGYPSDEIQKYAVEQKMDLIVIGTQGHRGLSRILLGSVAEKTVRIAKCPVMTIHASQPREDGEGIASLIPFRRILVATDFSPPAGRARDLGCAIASKYGAELHVLNIVVEPLPLPGPHGTWIRPEEATPAYVDSALRSLAEEVKEVELEPGLVVVRAVKVGYPVEAIQQYVADHQIDLIVLGTQGHGGLSHLLLGSIAEKIVRLAACPVLTTH